MSQGRPKGARNRTPEQIAIDAVEVEQRKFEALTERHERLLEEVEKVQIDLVATQKRRDYRLQNPDLPEGYEPVGRKKDEAKPQEDPLPEASNLVEGREEGGGDVA